MDAEKVGFINKVGTPDSVGSNSDSVINQLLPCHRLEFLRRLFDNGKLEIMDILRLGHTNKAFLVAAYSLLFEIALKEWERKRDLVIPVSYNRENKEFWVTVIRDKNQVPKRLEEIREEQQQWLAQVQSGTVTTKNPFKKHCSMCFISFQEEASSPVTRDFAAQGEYWGQDRVLQLMRFAHRRICRTCFQIQYFLKDGDDCVLVYAGQSDPETPRYTLREWNVQNIDFSQPVFQPHYKKPLWLYSGEEEDTVCFWKSYISHLGSLTYCRKGFSYAQEEYSKGKRMAEKEIYAKKRPRRNSSRR